MLLRLFLLFTIVPMVELTLLIWLSGRTSLLTTIGVVIATGIVGAWLARLEGWRVVTNMRADLAGGKVPGDSVLDALLILVAGAVLITPGLLTDAFGFALLIPRVRSLIKTYLKRRFANRFTIRRDASETFFGVSSDRTAGTESEVIDAKVIETRVIRDESADDEG